MTAMTITQHEWFSNYISATMSMLGVHAPDDDGDLPIRGTTSVGKVRLDLKEPWGVRVLALAAHGVPMKAAVLKEINAANLSVRGIRAVLTKNGEVYVDYLLFADAVSTDNLRSVIGGVLELADELGPMLATVYGGSTPIAPSSASED
jgi:hypothetical protein